MNLFIVLIAIAIICCIAYLIVKKIEQVKQKEKEKMEKQKRQREYEKRQNSYYNMLSNIYDDLPIQTLNQAYELLDEMLFYRPPAKLGYIRAIGKEQTANWWEAREKFLKLINPNRKYLWKNGKENSSAPVWEELDMKYIKNLLNRR